MDNFNEGQPKNIAYISDKVGGGSWLSVCFLFYMWFIMLFTLQNILLDG